MLVLGYAPLVWRRRGRQAAAGLTLWGHRGSEQAPQA